MKRNLLLLFVLLCTVVRAESWFPWYPYWKVEWDGKSEMRPLVEPRDGDEPPLVYIEGAGNMAYVRNHWNDVAYKFKGYDFCECDYLFINNVDMTVTSWVPFDGALKTKFNVNGHTIRIKIDNTSSNCQGLFKEIGKTGEVRNLHLVVDINVGNARKVGGICGDNYGTIENCWVTGNVKSSHYSHYDADLGGIAGLNESSGTIQYCCMSGMVSNPKNSGVGGLVGGNNGTVKHCTFYGSVENKHKQSSKYIGDQDGKLENYFDSYQDSEYNSGMDVYAKGVKYPYAITITNNGAEGSSVAQGYDGETITRWHPGGKVNIVSSWAKMNNVRYEYGTHVSNFSFPAAYSYSFDLPTDEPSDYSISVTYVKPQWLQDHAGTEGDPYPIGSTADWDELAMYNNGYDFSGKYFKLTADITVSEMVGTNGKPFKGIFDGNDKTLTFNRGTAAEPFNEEYCAPFRRASNATIRNLKVRGNIYTTRKFAAGLLGFGDGTTRVSDCSVATVIHSSVAGDGTHGGIVGHLNGEAYISDCAFTGRLLTTNGTTSCGGIVGWYYRNSPANNISNVFYSPANVTMGDGETAITDGATIVRGCSVGNNNYYTVALGEPQGTQVFGSVPSGEIYTEQALADGNQYYVLCNIDFPNIYQYTGSDIPVSTTVQTADGTTLTANEDYTLKYTTVQGRGAYNQVITSKGTRCFGTKSIPFMVADDTNSETLTAGEYTIHNDLTIEWRIPVEGHVVINIPENVTLTAEKGFELPEGNILTINGPGALVINDCEAHKSGIGGLTMGILAINGGKVTITGGKNAAGIGVDAGQPASGTVILGWTNKDDYISCNSYAVGSIAFTDGKQFCLSDKKTLATVDNIGGEKIVPRKITGTGTQSDPYMINSVEDWNDIAEAVNSGTASGYKDEFLKLNTDIEVTTMIGTDGNHTFRGTFDGDGHTLTFNCTTSEQYAAPFHYTYGATIKNLKTTGTITTSSTHAGGVVGRNGTQNTTLENVSSTVEITSTFSGRAYHGGLMGYAINATFTNCVFKGKLLGADSDHCGGLLGQKSMTEDTNASFTNCLFAPSEVTVSNNLLYSFASGDITKIAINNGCYYVTELGGAQGIFVTAQTAANEIYKKITAVDGNTYYMPCTVSYIDNYKHTGSDIAVIAPTITATDGTVLSADDFTFSPATVKDIEDYKLTVTGKEEKGCYGTKQFDFDVTDYAYLNSSITTLTEDHYYVAKDLTYDERITVSGNVTLHLRPGETLYARKGIELSTGNSLTVVGSGRIAIDNCDDGKSGIGAASMGTLNIQGGQLSVRGGSGAAGIGSDDAASASGSLTLDWDLAYSDSYIDCNSYATNVTFAKGKSFVVADQLMMATTENIGGNKIVPAVVLQDQGDNSDVLADPYIGPIAVVLKDRTLYMDGKWNTICLPFSYDISELRNVEARTLTDASIKGTTLNLTFGSSVTELKAGVPYIIKTAKEDDYEADGTHDYKTPVFEGVSISYDPNASNNCSFGSGDTQVSFIGTYSSQTFDAEDKSILLMGGENKLYYPKNGASIGACRAYFKIGYGTSAPRIDGFNISFDGDDSTLGVTTPLSDKRGAGGEAWYSLDGRRLQGKPAQKGVYINNGRKIVIK